MSLEVVIMERLLVLTVGICLLLTSVPAKADQAEDEAAISNVVDQVYAAMNRHDLNKNREWRV